MDINQRVEADMKAYFTVVKFEGQDPEFFSTTENVVGYTQVTDILDADLQESVTASARTLAKIVEDKKLRIDYLYIYRVFEIKNHCDVTDRFMGTMHE